MVFSYIRFAHTFFISKTFVFSFALSFRAQIKFTVSIYLN